ncbi:uncharacterized protein B0J16DRAFT_356302 [Fusarium flagelliforme]|uniref:uncharacterized protein n=1 Tax=Fusarium flagelliforme TaxID=2675880 RepID=UPI001E8ED9DA|nr:uncharacterized protein B0J16DRAFT_356302 [Fusarium flagelliforme]KAH7182258.1 hypothetical protein B0J16DRAFT_356302 [Fusarium flagelliforme]
MLITVGCTRKILLVHSYLQTSYFNFTTSLSVKICVKRYWSKSKLTTSSLPCANCNADGPTVAIQEGPTARSYCGPDCQQAHWPTYKVHCNSALNKATWTPNWVLQDRTPRNAPALNVLKLSSNEGYLYQGQLSLLFAASGDLRNLLTTIAQLPSSYKQQISITINNRDLNIVAQNVVMLLIALTAEEHNNTIDCIIHVWYSAFIRESNLKLLTLQGRPLIEGVCHKIRDKPTNAILGKSWKFGQSSFRLVLEKVSWDKLLTFLEVPGGLTVDRANQLRTAVTLVESRVDYRDRSFHFLPSSHRVAIYRFRQDSLLLTFGVSRNGFRHPNPTFFQTADRWPMYDNADPLNGWSAKDIEATSTGLATSDIYGKMYYYVRGVLEAFLGGMSSRTAAIEPLQVDASDLPSHLNINSFDRIEVYAGYLGIHKTVGIMSPLLRSPSINSHATLITSFMNVVDENLANQDRMAEAKVGSASTNPTSRYDPGVIMFSFARDSVTAYDSIFDRVAKQFRFSDFSEYLGAVAKEKHTVVEKWPFRLRLGPEQKGAKEEFDMMMRGGPRGKERYMEWKRL